MLNAISQISVCFFVSINFAISDDDKKLKIILWICLFNQERSILVCGFSFFGCIDHAIEKEEKIALPFSSYCKKRRVFFRDYLFDFLQKPEQRHFWNEKRSKGLILCKNYFLSVWMTFWVTCWSVSITACPRLATASKYGRRVGFSPACSSCKGIAPGRSRLLYWKTRGSWWSS